MGKRTRFVNVVNVLNDRGRVCHECGSNKTRLKKGRYPVWNRHKTIEGAWICQPCFNKHYLKTIANPKRDREEARLRNKNEYTFLNRVITLKENPRTGYCSNCPKNIHDGSCKRTNLHHEHGYYIIFPYFGLVELCVSCHNKVKIRDLDKRYCSICLERTTKRNKTGSYEWIRYGKDKFQCNKCYMKRYNKKTRSK